MLALAGTVAATTASAQGPPPFELPDDASQSRQVVRMQLGLNDPEEASPNFDEMKADSQFQATLNRTTLGNGATGTGRLIMFPLGTAAPLLPVAGGQLGVTELEDSGSSSFLVLESPSVTPGFYAPYVPIGTYDYDITCSGVVCRQFLEGPIESRAESSYDHADGTLEVDASVITPDYGVTDDTEGLYHALRSTAFARLGDWIYVTSAEANATVTIAATLPVALDAPDDEPDDVTPSEWITQGSGDLRELFCDDPIEPNVIQYTRFRLDFALTRWTFEEVCEDDGEGGEPVCTEEWVDAPLGTHTVSREREMHTVGCEGILDLVSSDTGALPDSTQLQVGIPTNQWVQLDVTTSTDADCEGAMACNLDARTSAPISVTIDAPNAELVAWRGIAGVTSVPEPGDAASIAAALAVLALRSRRQGKSR
jgi:hypothetical protein